MAHSPVIDCPLRISENKQKNSVAYKWLIYSFNYWLQVTNSGSGFGPADAGIFRSSRQTFNLPNHPLSRINREIRGRTAFRQSTTTTFETWPPSAFQAGSGQWRALGFLVGQSSCSGRKASADISFFPFGQPLPDHA